MQIKLLLSEEFRSKVLRVSENIDDKGSTLFQLCEQLMNLNYSLVGLHDLCLSEAEEYGYCIWQCCLHKYICINGFPNAMVYKMTSSLLNTIASLVTISNV